MKLPRFQFRLRTLMIGVVALSYALAAMRFATPAWATATVSVTVFLLLFSIVLAVYRRPFWVGFAICGNVYLAIAMMPVSPALMDLRNLIETLITTRSVRFLLQQFHPNDLSSYSEHYSNFMQIGQCLWALIIATVGGMIARFAAGRADGEAPAK
jgi:hypothetical protein